MVKVKFIKDWGKYKKKNTLEVHSKDQLITFMEFGCIEVSDEVKKMFDHYSLLRKYGFDPIKPSHSRRKVIECCLQFEETLQKGGK